MGRGGGGGPGYTYLATYTVTMPLSKKENRAYLHLDVLVEVGEGCRDMG